MSVKIDLITHDHKTDEFILILVEDGPWPNQASDWDACLSRIQHRIYDAIDVAVDGHLAAKFPDSKGKKVRVQVDSPNGAPSALMNLIAKIREHISKAGNDYNLALKESRYIDGLSISMGHERNPFN